MSWLDLDAAGAGPTAVRRAVVVMHAKQYEKTQALTLVVRIARLPDLTWWRHGARVCTQLGAGANAGQMRVALSQGPAGALMLRNVSGQNNGLLRAVALRLPALPGMALGDRMPEAVEFCCLDGWMQVTLPRWAVSGEALGLTGDAGAGAGGTARLGNGRNVAGLGRAHTGRNSAQPGDGVSP